MRTAIIAGATGLVGNQLLQLLLQSSDYQRVKSVGRRKIQIENPKLIQHICAFEQLSDLEIKADVVFCCLGTTIKKAGSKEAFRKVDFEYPKLLAKYGKSIGATSFHLITAMGADANSSIFYNQVKGDIEEYLTQNPFQRTHIYRPALLLGSRAEKRVMEKIAQALMKALGFLFIGALKNYKAIKAEKIAQYMLIKSRSQKHGSFIHQSGEMQSLRT